VSAGIRIESLTHRYGSKIALDNISLSVDPGCFCGLLGPNGAGKSTLVSLLSGLFAAREGRIFIAGHDIAREPRKALACMGIVFQSPTLDADLSVKQNMLYYAALHGLSGRPAVAAIEAALDRLGMRERMSETVKVLNGGHRRRMELARALIHRPTVLLLDEPTAGIDMAMRKSITAHVHELSAVDGISVLWTTHLADEIAPGDDVAILHRGQLAAHGQTESLTRGESLTAMFQRLTQFPQDDAA
jgi:ABC-2 type transport system ATP-binding protein